MAKFKGTPGNYGYRRSYFNKNEWEVYPLRDGPPEIGDWAEICTFKDQYRDDGNGADEAQYNAILFSASIDLIVEATRLLDRLSEFESDLEDDRVARNFYGHVSPSIANLKDAISKALGEE